MNISRKIESLLLVANRPLGAKELSRLCETSPQEVSAAIDDLKIKFNQDVSGIILIHAGDDVQFATSSQSSEVVARFVKQETVSELTRPQLETLTIIAYRGPIRKEEVESIRGVCCTMVLRNLAMRGLIEQTTDDTTMTVVYTVSIEFLRFLGLRGPEQLPDFEALSTDERITQVTEGQ